MNFCDEPIEYDYDALVWQDDDLTWRGDDLDDFCDDERRRRDARLFWWGE